MPDNFFKKHRASFCLLALLIPALLVGGTERAGAVTYYPYHLSNNGGWSLQHSDPNIDIQALTAGPENGWLDVYYGMTLTIRNGQTIGWNPGYGVGVYGTIVIQDGGQMKEGYFWIWDCDQDGWPYDKYYWLTIANSSPGGCWIRRYTETYYDQDGDDCDDGWYNQPWCDPG